VVLSEFEKDMVNISLLNVIFSFILKNTTFQIEIFNPYLKNYSLRQFSLDFSL